MIFYRYMRSVLYAILLVLLLNSCIKENTKVNPEVEKSIVGAWKIVSVTRNGVDITNYFDFSEFQIQFNEDGTYVVNNLVPFVIKRNGSWSLDNATHPLKISFVQQGSEDPLVNEFDYPVVDGKRRIVLMGSPGCASNSYVYALALE